MQFLTHPDLFDLILHFVFIFYPSAHLSFPLYFLSFPLHPEKFLHSKYFIQDKSFRYFGCFWLHQRCLFLDDSLQLLDLRYALLNGLWVLLGNKFSFLLLLEQRIKHFAFNEKLLHFLNRNLKRTLLDEPIFQLVNITWS